MALAALHQWLVFAHVLAAMVWVGGLAALAARGTYVRRAGEVEAVGRFVASLRVVGPLVLTPAAVLVLASGTWMVADSAGLRFGATWIWLALVLLVVAVLVGAVFLSRAALAAERAVSRRARPAPAGPGARGRPAARSRRSCRRRP